MWDPGIRDREVYQTSMEAVIQVDRFVRDIGLAESVSAAKRLRLAGAVAIGVEGEELEVIREAYVRIIRA